MLTRTKRAPSVDNGENVEPNSMPNRPASSENQPPNKRTRVPGSKLPMPRKTIPRPKSSTLPRPPSKTAEGKPMAARTNSSGDLRGIAASAASSGPSPAKEAASRAASPRSGPRAASLRSSPARGVSATFSSRITPVYDQKLRSFLDEMEASARWKPKAKQFESKLRMEQQKEFITVIQGRLLELKQQLPFFYEACLEVERDMYLQLRATSDRAALIERELESAREELKRIQEKERSTTEQLIRLQAELGALQHQRDGISELQGPMMQRLQELEREQPLLQEQLARKREECEHLQLELQNTRAQMTELRGAKELELASERNALSKQMEDKIGEYKTGIASLQSRLTVKEEELSRIINEKILADRRIAELSTDIAVMQGEKRGGDDQLVRLRGDVTRLSDELATCREALSVKDKELSMTIGNLTAIQLNFQNREAELKESKAQVEERLHTVEEEYKLLTQHLTTKKEEAAGATAEIASLRETIRSLQERLEKLEDEYKEASQQAAQSAQQLAVEHELRLKSEYREEEERKERIAASAQLVATQQEAATRLQALRDEMTGKAAEHEQQLKAQEDRLQQVLDELRAATEHTTALEAERRELKEALENANTHAQQIERLGRVSGEVDVLRRRLQEAEETRQMEKASYERSIEELNAKIREGEVARRKMHNTIQELRGNVRVFARVRPFLPNDNLDINTAVPCVVAKPDGVGVMISRPSADGSPPIEDHFAFDKAFPPSASQETVFQEVSEFVQSACDGYNVCLFSYGQTGSGKTHTMQGSGNGSMRGMIPRAIAQVGAYKSQLEEQGWRYSMEVSFIEIYNETIRDLLRDTAKDNEEHEIRHTKDGTEVTNVTMIPVDPNDQDQIEEIMRMAARHRSVGHTDMNAQSSRSHSVFTLHLRAENARHSSRSVLKGSLALVDLAGSERLSRSGATGERLKETQAINKSLSALADVFAAIANKASHIPFRNSKLTYLLQNALSGDGKTLMLVNLSPTEESVHESMCSLRFAAQVNQCELGKPKRHMRDASGSASAAPPAKRQTTRK